MMTRGAASGDDFDELLADLVAETSSLRRMLAGIPGPAWDRPTPAAGWAVRDQVSHLAYFDEAARTALEDPDRFVLEAATLTGRAEDFADSVARELRHRPPADLLDWFDDARATLVRAYRRADPRARIPWYGPSMSGMSAATARLMETWAHGVDVADALGWPVEESPRLRHVAYLGVRTMGFSFALHGLDVPTDPVRVELRCGRHHWEFGPDGAPDVVRGSAVDFCLTVTQRRNPADTGLEVTGPVASAWMGVAQAFAGRPTLPRRAVGAGRSDTADGAPITSLQRNLIQRINVGDLLTRTARRSPEREAIIDGRRRVAYGELNGWVNRVANGLRARGYERGDRLGLVAANSAEFLVVYFACAKLGVVCVPVNLGWRPDEVSYVLGHSRCRGIVVERGLLAGLVPAVEANPGVTHLVLLDPGGVGAGPGARSALPGLSSVGRVETLDQLAEGAATVEPEAEVDDRDPISILYTSGTTAAPKGVVASHAAVYVETLSMALESRFDGTDRFVAMLPMFHTAQLNVHCTPAVAVGASIHVMRAFEPGVLLATIEQEGITQIFGLPMMYRAMLDHPDMASRDLSSLRRATYAMAPMPDTDLRRAIAAFGCDFSLLFGQTEMSPSTTIFRPEHQLSHAGAVGTPVVNVEVAVMAPDGTLLDRGEQGEIVYRGPHTMTGYLADEVATNVAFAHGWFHSGDAGAFDADGILWFRDRWKDVIKTGGENVASLEVERAILAHVPGVTEAAVVGISHDRWSEAITAFVVAAEGASVDADTVRRQLRDHLDGYKVPKAVVVVDVLPRTSTGKVRKTQLRNEHRALYEGSP